MYTKRMQTLNSIVNLIIFLITIIILSPQKNHICFPGDTINKVAQINI